MSYRVVSKNNTSKTYDKHMENENESLLREDPYNSMKKIDLKDLTKLKESRKCINENTM